MPMYTRKSEPEKSCSNRASRQHDRTRSSTPAERNNYYDRNADGANSHQNVQPKPITFAFLHFTDNDERDTFVRSANILKKELRGRKIRILPAMDAEERFYPERLGCFKCCIHTRHNVPLVQIKMNRLTTCIGRRSHSDQNMCKWISQVPQISRHRSRSR